MTSPSIAFSNRNWLLRFILRIAVTGLTFYASVSAQMEQHAANSLVPRVWEDEAIATAEVPLANPVGSPKHISSSYYYQIPVRPIYKSYPVYAPGREPAGYMGWLEKQQPEIVWDDTGRTPTLKTERDWIQAGEMVFDTPIYYTTHRVPSLDQIRNPKWYEKTGAPIARNGTLPMFAM